jgi:hypothetical protein
MGGCWELMLGAWAQVDEPSWDLSGWMLGAFGLKLMSRAGFWDLGGWELWMLELGLKLMGRAGCLGWMLGALGLRLMSRAGI